MAMGTILPSIFLSGYVFPLDSMPRFFRWIAHVIPTTWLIDAARGVILRGAGWRELWQHAAVLWGMAIATLTVASLRLRKRLASMAPPVPNRRRTGPNLLSRILNLIR